MVNISSNTAQLAVIPAQKEIIKEEKLNSLLDEQIDRAIVAITEVDELAKLREDDLQREMESVSQFNSDYKEYQIRKAGIEEEIINNGHQHWKAAYDQQQASYMVDEMV